MPAADADPHMARITALLRQGKAKVQVFTGHRPNDPNKETTMSSEMIDSTSDQRTVKNVMRHSYRVLSDEEKAQMQAVKDAGLSFHELITSLGDSRELALARTKVEEAVMWATKHIT